MASIILVGCYNRDMSSDNKNLETIEHTLGMNVGEKIFKLNTCFINIYNIAPV